MVHPIGGERGGEERGEKGVGAGLTGCGFVAPRTAPVSCLWTAWKRRSNTAGRCSLKRKPPPTAPVEAHIYLHLTPPARIILFLTMLQLSRFPAWQWSPVAFNCIASASSACFLHLVFLKLATTATRKHFFGRGLDWPVSKFLFVCLFVWFPPLNVAGGFSACRIFLRALEGMLLLGAEEGWSWIVSGAVCPDRRQATKSAPLAVFLGSKWTRRINFCGQQPESKMRCLYEFLNCT